MKDYIGRADLNAIFGDHIVGRRVPDILCQFQYGVSSYDTKTTTTGTGAVTAVDATAQVSTGSGTGKARLESVRTLRYQPGFDGYAMFTAAFSAPEEGVTQRVGLFDDDNGFWLGYDGLTFKCGVRSAGTDNAVEPACWWDDLDFTKLNIYRINYGYLGTAPVIFEVYAGIVYGWVKLSVRDFTNALVAPHTQQPTQAIAMEVERTSGSGAKTIRSASWSAGRIGTAVPLPSDRTFSLNSSKSGVSTETNIITIRSKATHNSLTNKIVAQLDFLAAAVDGTKNVTVYVKKNATLGGTPSYTDVSSDASVMEYDTAGTTVTGGTQVFSFPLAKASTGNLFVRDLGIQIMPEDTLTISVSSVASTDCDVDIRWSEFF